jgi:nicotinate-nucleotide--dimethylbenzimidazole phosphoribosyltransferase
MSILDDAIREHLELKRAHGADEAELKRLEDEAFGPPGRPEEPDPFAEAPTEFMATPEAPADAEPAESSGGRRINIADLQEPPPPERAEEREEPRVEATDAIEPEAEAAPLAPAEDAAQAAPPAEEDLPAAEEPSAMEHEVVLEPAAEAPPEPAAAEVAASEETQERHAIAEQPTELFDIEAEMGTEDAPAETTAEIQASRTEPPAAPPADEDEEDEEFWSEQRLSDELDQALEAPPLTAEHEAPPRTDVHEIPAPVADPSAPIHDDEEGEGGEDDSSSPDYDPDTGHEDVLEDTPDFLEDAPEDDELWFEQKPPKDFDLD